MRFGILGCLEAEAGGRRLPLGGLSEQKVLAVLLLDANRTVPVSRLVDALWDDPPETAVKQARNAVSRLRRVLAQGGIANAVVTDGAGYRLVVAEEALDARRFEALVARAQADAARARYGEAAETLRQALSLWRGPALAGLTGHAIEAAATSWNERRCAVMETYYDVLLALGRHRELAADLTAQVSDYPLREKQVEKLILALYRCGRRADALAVYDKTRARLAEELGIDPGPELQRLHHQVLTDDPVLAAAWPAGATVSLSSGKAGPAARARHTGRPRRVQQRGLAVNGRPRPRVHVMAIPRQLPAGARFFAGRAAELAVLDGLLDQASGTVVITAISGAAGIGKTALAVHWAHHAAARFPEGQLYVNLRGFAPGSTPVTPAEAIDGFLDALDVPSSRVPATVEDKAALYRSLLAGRRVLVVLDNARDAAQARPLLPGSPGCLAVVTSRAQLTGLVAAEGAHQVTLGLLSHDDARNLLEQRLGRERTTREPAAVGELVDACARLPLALSIAAAQAGDRPSLTLSALAAGLRHEPGRLDAFDTGDSATTVRAAFSWSYRQLSDSDARMFRRLGLHPGPDFSLLSAASAAGMPAGQARNALARLTRAHLLTEHAPGRYSFHDLLRSYAAEQAQAHDDGAERHDVIHRVLDHYLYTADVAAALLDPTQVRLSLPTPHPAVHLETFGDEHEALAWFEAEHQALLAAAARAKDWPGAHAWQLPRAMGAFYSRRGYVQGWVATHQVGLTAAHRLGDRTGQAMMHHGLAMALTCASQGVGEPDRHEDPAEPGDQDNPVVPGQLDARAHFRQAIALFAASGDKVSEARAEFDLGWAIATGGHPAEGAARLRRSHGLYQAAGHDIGQALALTGLTWCWARSGRADDALAASQQAIVRHQQLGYRTGEAYAWHAQGLAHRMLGHHREALDSYRRSVELCREIGEEYHTAAGLDACGDCHHADGDLGAAQSAWQEALAILDDLQHPEAAKVTVKLARLSASVLATHRVHEEVWSALQASALPADDSQAFLVPSRTTPRNKNLRKKRCISTVL